MPTPWPYPITLNFTFCSSIVKVKFVERSPSIVLISTPESSKFPTFNVFTLPLSVFSFISIASGKEKSITKSLCFSFILLVKSSFDKTTSELYWLYSSSP